VRLGFYQPDIPQNLGAALRLAACFDVPVDVIEPCGFPLTDKSLRRTAMDYGAAAMVQRHASWTAYLEAQGRSGGRIVLFSTRGEESLPAFRFQPSDTLLFGRESAGAPEEVHAAAGATVRIPLAPGVRSLNVVMSAGMALWEALRQTGGLPLDPPG
jgi:tRNA (cytidine/uridine-2'-O-)-methyltransferase